MAAPCYAAYNAVTSALNTPMVGTALVANTPKTVLQVKLGVPKVRIIEYGYAFTTAPVGPVQCELLDAGAVFATVTAGAVVNLNDVTGPVSQAAGANISTTGTGYNASAEGTITASRLLDINLDMASMFKKQWPLGREPEVNGGNSLRMRFLSAAAITVMCYVAWEE